jgi:hypothetical protein
VPLATSKLKGAAAALPGRRSSEGFIEAHPTPTAADYTGIEPLRVPGVG